MIRATVTAYNPVAGQTDNTPYTTAFLREVNPKYVAVSWDIFEGLGWGPGDKIYIDGIGVRTIGDLMSRDIKGFQVDLFMWKVKDAKAWGVKKNVIITLLKEECDGKV